MYIFPDVTLVYDLLGGFRLQWLCNMLTIGTIEPPLT